jgi:hypothetical protein
MMEYYNDGILLDVESMVDAHPIKDDKTATRIVCHNLLRFVYDKGLLSRSPFNENGELKQGVIIKESDLSEKIKLFSGIYQKNGSFIQTELKATITV